MGMSKKIKILMLKKDITQKQLAEKLGISQPTLSKKFTLDNWRESDLVQIAEVCGCRFEGTFIFEDERI